MSILDEINRLQLAKADIRSSIINKGSYVPAEKKLNDYSDYIDNIQNGGFSDESFAFGGTNAELVYEDNTAITKAQTSWTNTFSTSATSIKSSQSRGYSPYFDPGEYVIVTSSVTRPILCPDGSQTAQPISSTSVNVYNVYMRNTLQTGTSYSLLSTVYQTYVTKYYNTSGVISTVSGQYGVYTAAPSFSISGASSGKWRGNMSLPVVYTRYSNTYATTSNLAKITDFTITVSFKVYKLKDHSSALYTIEEVF